MIGQTRRSSSIARRAGRLAGAVGLLLALGAIASGLMPVHASLPPIPPMPHGFVGTARVTSPPGLVPPGILVEAFLDGVKKAETTVDAQSRYALVVDGPGTRVTFKIGGVLAAETATWESGRIDNPFDLTIAALPQVNLTISSTAGGSVTVPGEGNFIRTLGTVVNLVASPNAGYVFLNWTGNVSTIANVNAASTTITMLGNYSITANFRQLVEPVQPCELIISSTTGGNVTVPGEGRFTYNQGTVVNLTATADSGYRFDKWSGDVGTIANVNADSTVIIMSGNYSITANFKKVSLFPGLPCFIATAAYGSPTAKQLNVLREFRDEVLLRNSLGAALVSLYYRTSPPIAEFIARHDFVRTLVRVGFVDLIVEVLDLTHNFWSGRGS